MFKAEIQDRLDKGLYIVTGRKIAFEPRIQNPGSRVFHLFIVLTAIHDHTYLACYRCNLDSFLYKSLYCTTISDSLDDVKFISIGIAISGLSALLSRRFLKYVMNQLRMTNCKPFEGAK